MSASSGIFAPTIRHHDGRFWIVGTNIIDVMAGRGQFIITSDDPAGHWSDPVFVPRHSRASIQIFTGTTRASAI